MLVRKKLTADEFSPPYLRYDETCDCVQFTPDGGDTWIDMPANDPRTSDAYRLPPNDDQCQAAEGMRAIIQASVDERLARDNELEIAGGILGIVAFIPGFNVLWALILAFAALAVTVARELLEAAFTETIYDQIRCTFFCNIGADGQMSQGQFDAAYADFADVAQYPDVITRLWVHSVMDLVGPVGLSDAGVKLAAAADCDDCACGWCYQWTGTGELTDGGWTFDYANGSPSAICHKVFDATIISVAMAYATFGTGNAGGTSGAALWADSWFGSGPSRKVLIAPLGGGYGSLVWTPDGATVVTGLAMGCNCGAEAGDSVAQVITITINGQDEMPAFTGGSVC